MATQPEPGGSRDNIPAAAAAPDRDVAITDEAEATSAGPAPRTEETNHQPHDQQQQDPAPPASPPLPPKHIPATPGPRAAGLREVYRRALERTLEKVSWDNVAACYPTVAARAPATLRAVQGQMVALLREKCDVGLCRIYVFSIFSLPPFFYCLVLAWFLHRDRYMTADASNPTHCLERIRSDPPKPQRRRQAERAREPRRRRGEEEEREPRRRAPRSVSIPTYAYLPT